MDIKQNEESFYIGEEEGKKAELHFTIEGETIVVDHTFVSDELRGQGVAGKLLHQVVQMAREQNKKITPTCSYAKKKLQDTKEYHDVLS
ncbi:GNAT family N-acetyltransferase [Priestia endophytica]|jgi:uncharacterized protein|uniref:N-acetyltransferase domain-containing protein n=1 Tax=Priestia endophytica DSM 13796 TaxID=1121089 RepID=A0A1I5ZDZ0_9BACI|nr:GNAT family N-acetyltransferase [Priestia endophytica]KAB2494139.1 N-acetyltransferase [Priestia endophytica]KYG29921.1 acetyltransferase [Priestia endophytica]MBG9812676.1 acetyltransferase [Priestia endophytica]RAS78869.1 N-acetyltransferase [Priestia endophytica]SFQ54660.1 hypothetical protein SAMN02745910_01955 [Priestia endophytica DSM 13796]